MAVEIRNKMYIHKGLRRRGGGRTGDRPYMGGSRLTGSHILCSQPRRQNSCEGCSSYDSEKEGENSTQISDEEGYGAKKVDARVGSFVEMLNHEVGVML